MNVFDLLPKFNIIEPNNLKGLQPGFVVSQVEPKGAYDSQNKLLAPAAAEAANKLINATKVNGYYFVENGQLAQLTADGYIDYGTNHDTAAPIFVTYTEERLTFGSDFKYYAAEITEDPVRLVQLIPGDEFTTTYAPTSTQMATAIADGRIACITRNYITNDSTATAHGQYCFDNFLDCNKFADGQPAYTYVFLK